MESRKELLAKKFFAVPVAVCLMVFCVLGLACAPMFGASPKSIPLAIVNSDSGIAAPSGETLNGGQTMVAMLTGPAGKQAAGGVALWSEVNSEDELYEALDRGDYYGAIVIPEGYTAMQAKGDQPSVDVVINFAKSPVLAQTLQPMISSVLTQAGIQPNIETIGNTNTGGGPMAGLMCIQFIVMPLYVMSMLMGILLAVLRGAHLKKGSGKVKELALWFGYCVFGSLLAGVFSYGIASWIGGVSIGISAIAFLWLASFCLMLFTAGLCSIAVPLGALCMIVIFALGTSTAVLPAPMLPEFWANWVLPWAPQADIGDALRNIVYLDGAPFEIGVGTLLIWGCAGAVLLVARALLVRPSSSDETL